MISVLIQQGLLAKLTFVACDSVWGPEQKKSSWIGWQKDREENKPFESIDGRGTFKLTSREKS